MLKFPHVLDMVLDNDVGLLSLFVAALQLKLIAFKSSTLHIF